MKFAFHALLATCCATALSAQAQETIDLSRATFYPGANDSSRLFVYGIKIPGSDLGYGAQFVWDPSTSSLKADLATINVSGYNPPACTARLFYEATITNSNFPAPLTKQAYISVYAAINIFTRQIDLTFQPESNLIGGILEVAPYFFPQQLRLIQSGTTYSVHDISNNNTPHFDPKDGWVPTQNPVTSNSATITNFPASFDLSKSFYIYYGKGTPTTPAADGTDSYTLCNG